MVSKVWIYFSKFAKKKKSVIDCGGADIGRQWDRRRITKAVVESGRIVVLIRANVDRTTLPSAPVYE